MNKKLTLSIALITALSFSTAVFSQSNTSIEKNVESSISNNVKVIAISYFDNTADIKDLDPLKKGMADMLISDLSKVKSLKIVEREKFEKIIKEIDLGKNKYFDQKTAQALGKGLKAEYILTGSYILLDKKFRIDARLIKIDSGEVIMSEKSEGLKSEFFDIQKDLVENIISSLNINLDRQEKKDLREYTTQSFEAVERYSRGLEAKDNGKEEEASKYFKAALEADSQYKLAKNALDRIKVIVNKNIQNNNNKFDDLMKNLDLKDPDLNAKLSKMIFDLNIGSAYTRDSLLKRVSILKFIVKNKLRPYNYIGSLEINQEVGAINLLDIFCIRKNFDLIQHAPEIYEYLSIKYPNDTMAHNSIKTNYEETKEILEQIKINRDIILKNQKKIDMGIPIFQEKDYECNNYSNITSEMDRSWETILSAPQNTNFIEKYNNNFIDKLLKPYYEKCKVSNEIQQKLSDDYYINLINRLFLLQSRDLAKEYVKRLSNRSENKSKIEHFDMLLNRENIQFAYLGKDLEKEIKELITLMKEAKKSF